LTGKPSCGCTIAPLSVGISSVGNLFRERYSAGVI
jgi:hypothetical protein